MTNDPESGWSIVVAGFWNPAILTPDGIRKRLFKLPDTAVISVEVALDLPGPIRVTHEDLTVVPRFGRLVVELASAEPSQLSKAAELATTALENLPETPVTAAGVNIRSQVSLSPDRLDRLLGVQLDEALSDASFVIKSRSVLRTLSMVPGVVNVSALETPDGLTLDTNFHLPSRSAAELTAWLRRVDEFLQSADKLKEVIGREAAKS